MASDPTDLIREADAALDGITPEPWSTVTSERGQIAVVNAETKFFIALLHPDDQGTEVGESNVRFIASAPDLVRRLRDDVHRLRTELGEWTTATLRLIRERDEARADLAEVLTAITGETEQALLVRSGWIVAEAGGCTCYGGGPYGHEPGCGLEPIVKLADVGRTGAALAEAKATIERVRALCDDKSAGPLYESLVRRAIEGPAT
ncbi:hypothetical protein [Tsukamurella tyrosinosolvens]|uniref:hypothetical protein n=1 Tax=Tsukamurella tyrosinosolvens TaxID=57704 RepID=UPI002DD42CFA|nr:hypothetical protein [Tsukamurella tyrosinosolvens]MEC4616282.1 hypothetical protein [Tsukamurella tyrosinosolvens]